MSSDTINLNELLDAVEALREEVGGLREEVSGFRERVATLEDAAASQTAAADDAEQEELVMTISAAIAAFLGVQPHIRQIRLLGGASWAEHGRASIQASHILNFHDR